ncbi:putative Uncharacterized RNA-binding protein C3H8.09c [Glarea lozoyensis 74030]|uniref:Putative Uncharacterized RNA-binding protein C3H8.09c n=1 Tax=Glarea lozoyensis (strain ATCC 74030 / MF5533) TaxID=1104152 RepID=H0EP47_GLAL7|nr:putative Uncharacterized RNA-binding protein C3H8.09c [Glarea lozoyensis 74030]
MTSTTDPSEPTQSTDAASADPEPEQAADTPASDISNFSDAYKEQAVDEEEIKEKSVDQVAEVSDDYAMTFDSDGEEVADSLDVAAAQVEQPAVLQPATIPVIDCNQSISIESSSNDVPQNGQFENPTQNNSSSLPAPIEAPSNHSTSPAVQAPVSTAPDPSNQYENIANGGVDIQQLLDNITANAERNEAASAQSPSSQNANSSYPKPSVALPAHSSLPPRPLAQNYAQNEDMQKYHAGPPGMYRDPTGGLPPPPSSSFRQPMQSTASPNSPSFNQFGPPGQLKGEQGDEVDDIDARWGPEVQAKYDAFLERERKNVTEGLWERFEKDSRLFLGNLPSEKVTKRDLFHVFHKYGDLAQVSIKQAYGFVQFHTAESCRRALQKEQGVEVRGRKIHLEVSKPQKNSRNAQQQQNNARQDRSPDRAQQSRGGQRRNNGNRNGNDSYDGRSEPRDDYGRQSRMRRSPSPPRGAFRGRDDYGGRGRDSYNNRDARRSRSRSPYNNRDNIRYRERSPSPRRNQMQEPELQIPRRDWDKVPDVQIIMMEQLDRGFVEWVEKQFINRGLKTEVMILSPRVSLEAVIQRQILENVHAVSQLTVQSQRFNRIPIQVFKRRGTAEVQWEEYENLEPHIAAELVVREKNSQPPPQAPPIPAPYPPPQQYAPPPDPRYAPAPSFPAAPNLPATTIDQNTLQSLLGSLKAHTQNAPAVAANSAVNLAGNQAVDLAALIGGLQNQQRQQQPTPNAYAPPPVHSYSPLPGQAQQPSYMQQPGQIPQQSYMPQPGQIPQQGYMPQSAPPPRENDQQVQNIMATFMRNRQ